MKKIETLLDKKISFPAASRPLFETVRLFEDTLGSRVGQVVVVNTQSWLNSGIFELRVSLGAQNEPARDVLLRIIKSTHYRYYWLVRTGPGKPSWAVNLQPLLGQIIRSPGNFAYPRILWPGARPLPPIQPPPPPVR